MFLQKKLEILRGRCMSRERVSIDNQESDPVTTYTPKAHLGEYTFEVFTTAHEVLRVV